MRGKAAVLLSAVMGLLAVLLMLAYVRGRESELLQQAAMRDVLIATRDILPGSLIDEQMVQGIQVPTKYVQPQGITDLREALGRVVVVPVPRGAQLLGTYLEDIGRTALAYEVPRGRRAITIAVSDVTGVAGLVRPGNFVDIFGTFEFGRPVGNQGGRVQYDDERTETLVLMQNVPVVAVDRETQGERPVSGSAEPRTLRQAETQAVSQRTREIRNVTVLVGPGDAQRLVLAQEVGTLTLALRSNLDAGQVENLGPLDPFKLLGVSVPIKTRARPIWRELRGGVLPP